MNTEPGKREETPERKPLPNFYVCIAPDEKSLVIDFLRNGDGETGRLHLQLCAHCKEIVETAATRMRERCVEKVREIREVWHSVATENLSPDDDNAFARVRQRECGIRAISADRIITALESLTLDGEKEQ